MLQNVKHYILNIAILNNDFTLYIYKREKENPNKRIKKLDIPNTIY